MPIYCMKICGCSSTDDDINSSLINFFRQALYNKRTDTIAHTLLDLTHNFHVLSTVCLRKSKVFMCFSSCLAREINCLQTELELDVAHYHRLHILSIFTIFWNDFWKIMEISNISHVVTEKSKIFQ